MGGRFKSASSGAVVATGTGTGSRSLSMIKWCYQGQETCGEMTGFTQITTDRV